MVARVDMHVFMTEPSSGLEYVKARGLMGLLFQVHGLL